MCHVCTVCICTTAGALLRECQEYEKIGLYLFNNLHYWSSTSASHLDSNSFVADFVALWRGTVMTGGKWMITELVRRKTEAFSCPRFIQSAVIFYFLLETFLKHNYGNGTPLNKSSEIAVMCHWLWFPCLLFFDIFVLLVLILKKVLVTVNDDDILSFLLL